jgi:predicted site-specific integrase-resolvase
MKRQKDHELMTPEEVAELYRRPVGTLAQWRCHGRGPVGFRLAGRVMYRRTEVLRWLAEQEASNA